MKESVVGAFAFGPEFGEMVRGYIGHLRRIGGGGGLWVFSEASEAFTGARKRETEFFKGVEGFRSRVVY